MKTAAILGSVVLKKAFDFLDKKAIRAALYAPKLSIAALPNHNAEIPAERLLSTGLDGFIRSVIARDFGKTFFDELRKTRPDYLLIDLLDDLSDLLMDPVTSGVVTKSNYLSRINLHDYGLENWQSIKNNSELRWSLFEIGCEELAKNIPIETQIIIVRFFQSEIYAGESGEKIYSSRLLDRIRENNRVLERSYQIISKHINCTVLDIPEDLLVSQTDESRGFNPTDLSEFSYSKIARKIAECIHLDTSVIPCVEERVEQIFDLFGPVLQQDVPSISDLHTMGRRYLERGDVEKARRTERLIVLLKNSSVPLSVKMGKVMFGYGGIGVVIHAECKIGDFVNIGANVTLGGGRSRFDENGMQRQIPYVGNRVYIATGAKLLGGITVGDHSIIGANAVVTNDVPPFSVVAGNPARVIVSITPDNFSKYSSYLYKGMPAEDVKRLMFGG